MFVRPAGLLVRDRRLLVMRYRYHGHLRYNLPGGGREPGESASICLVREFREEMGLDVQVGDLLLAAETAAGGREVLHLLFTVTADTWATPHLDPVHTKAEGLEWLTPEAVAKADLYPAMSSSLSAWLAGGGPLEKVYCGLVEQPWFG